MASFESLIRAKGVSLVPYRVRHFHPTVTLFSNLLLRPIVLIGFPGRVWPSRFRQCRGAKLTMNSTDPFEALVSAHYDLLFRFAMSLTHRESDALDLTQQTFYIWATKGHQLHDRSKAKTWLYTTLHRTFLNSHKRQGRFPHYELEEVMHELPAHIPDLHSHADSRSLLTALAGVDEIYRATVALFYLEDCPYKEIAMILDVPLGTVKSRLARGLAQLRKILLADGAPLSCPQPPVRLPERTLTRESSEWDFSASHLPEQFGMTTVICLATPCQLRG